MAAIFAPVDEVAAAVAPMADRLAIAAINAADSVVVSRRVRRGRGGARRLRAAQRARSSPARLARGALAAGGAGARCDARPARAASTMRGAASFRSPGTSPAAAPCPAARRMRPTGGGTCASRCASRDGIACAACATATGIFLEVGPHPTLIGARAALAARGRAVPRVAAARQGRLARADDEPGRALCAGRGRSTGPASTAIRTRRARALPTYPFERQSFWITGRGAGSVAPSRPACGQRSIRCSARVCRRRLPIFETHAQAATRRPILRDHRRARRGPRRRARLHRDGAGRAHARRFRRRHARSIADFMIHEPLVLPEDGRIVQTVVRRRRQRRDALRDPQPRELRQDGAWTLHAERSARCAGGRPPQRDRARALDRVEAPARPVRLPAASRTTRACASSASISARAFRSAPRGASARRRGARALALADHGVRRRRMGHPALLDGALQAVGLAAAAERGRRRRPSARRHRAHRARSRCRRLLLVPCAPARRRLHRASRNGAPTSRCATPQAASSAALRGVRLRRASRESLRAKPGGAAGATRGPLLPASNGSRRRPVPRAARALRSPAAFIAARARAVPNSLARDHGLAVYDDAPARARPAERRSRDRGAARTRLRLDVRTPSSTPRRKSRALRRRVAAIARLFGRMLDMLAEDGVLRRRAPVIEVVARGCGTLDTDGAATRGCRRASRHVDGELSHAAPLRRRARARAPRRAGPARSCCSRTARSPKRASSTSSRPTRGPTTGRSREALACGDRSAARRRRLRILEIGAGTGGTTQLRACRCCRADRVEYIFTDLSPLFLERAGEQFAGLSVLRRALLDIERDPATQGFDPARYDIVIAANVLHATADLRPDAAACAQPAGARRSVAAARRRRPGRWVDLTFGLTEGWWRFTDYHAAADYPLIDRAAWRRAPRRRGFTDVAVMPDGDESARAARAAGADRRARCRSRQRRLRPGRRTRGRRSPRCRPLQARGDAAMLLG